MRRREFLSVVCGAAAWPLTARAQQVVTVRLVGVLMDYAASDQAAQPVCAIALRALLARLLPQAYQQSARQMFRSVLNSMDSTRHAALQHLSVAMQHG